MKAKRITTLLALLLMAGVTMQAQHWEIDFGDPTDINQHSRINAGIIDANGDAVLVGRFGRRRDWNTQLIKVHPDGSYERHVNEDLPKMLFFYDVVQLKNGNYFTVATRIQDTTMINFGGNELWAIVLNDNLDILEAQVYTQHTLELISSPCLLVEDDGNVVACGEWYERLYWSFPYMYRFNENADTLACRYEKPENYVYNDPIFQMHDFKCYKIIKNPLEDGYIFLCDHGGMGAAFYDENFQYKKAYRYGTATYIFAVGNKGYSDYLLSDNSMLVFCTRCEDDGIDEYHLCLADLDLGGSKERGNGIVNRFVTNFHHKENRKEEQCMGKSMATVNDTTMYGCYYTWYELGGDMQTGLCLFDRDMEILGGRFFDEAEYLNYGAMFVLPYDDGGCLLVMDGGANMLGPYCASKVLKLNREEMNPITTSVKEMPVMEIQGKAYPNPARDVLNIDLSGMENIEGCRISITDALGRPCLDRFIRGEGNVLAIGVSGLKAGVYFYRVYNAEKELLNGKWIKQ